MVATTDDGRKRSFLDSYKTADEAEKYLREQFEDTPLVPTAYGIDMRHRELSYDETDRRPDLKVSIDGDIRAFIEVKSKRNADWMFVTNQYQWDDYVSHAQAHDKPTYICWVHVDDDEGIVHDTQFVEVREWEQVTDVWTAPDGNTVVRVQDDTALNFGDFVEEIESDLGTDV